MTFHIDMAIVRRNAESLVEALDGAKHAIEEQRLRITDLVRHRDIAERQLVDANVADQVGRAYIEGIKEGWSQRDAERAELLTALEGVVRVADRDTDEFVAARAAIAKARGAT